MEITKQIVLTDQTIAMLRDFWMNAKPEEKLDYREKLNAALDHRLNLMQARDNQGE
jgi:hypothetical protein